MYDYKFIAELVIPAFFKIYLKEELFYVNNFIILSAFG